jgi:hypothetical protein
MKYKLVNREEYANLLEEVKQLRRLVDSLCVAIGDEPKDERDRRSWFRGRAPATSHGYRLVRIFIGQDMMRELEDQMQTLREDFPTSTTKS